MINIEHLSIKNRKKYNKPNEDYILIGSNKKIFVILDGVSRDLENNLYPNPSPASKATEILGNGILNNLVEQEQEDTCIDLKEAIHYGNSLVKRYNKKLSHSFLAGAVGVIAYLHSDKLLYAYIGDSVGAIISNDSIKYFTKQQTKLIREHKGKFARDEIRNNICNNEEHPYCYGVLNGQETALSFVEFGEIELNKNDTILLMTDGMEKLFNIFSLFEIKNESCKSLIKGVEQLEDIHDFTDDKSIIKIQL